MSDVTQTVIAALGARGKKARFLTEVAASVGRANIGKEELERVISDLAAQDAILVRDHFCADPHLAEVDLRVAALIDAGAGGDGYAAALHEIDLVWNKWLGEFLANHRCG